MFAFFIYLLTYPTDGKVLPEDLTHYVVPDAGVVVDYLEILELRELQGVVFTQTACQALQHSKGRRYTHQLAEHSQSVKFSGNLSDLRTDYIQTTSQQHSL